MTALSLYAQSTSDACAYEKRPCQGNQTPAHICHLQKARRVRNCTLDAPSHLQTTYWKHAGAQSAIIPTQKTLDFLVH